MTTIQFVFLSPSLEATEQLWRPFCDHKCFLVLTAQGIQFVDFGFPSFVQDLVFLSQPGTNYLAQPCKQDILGSKPLPFNPDFFAPKAV